MVMATQKIARNDNLVQYAVRRFHLWEQPLMKMPDPGVSSLVMKEPLLDRAGDRQGHDTWRGHGRTRPLGTGIRLLY
jgi:hypothetical protein